MKEIIKKKGNNLEIKLTIPLKKKRYNFHDDEFADEMDSIVGVIDNKMADYGFAFRIDLSYKGKEDQFTDFFYKYQGSKEDFKKLCKDLGIGMVNY